MLCGWEMSYSPPLFFPLPCSPLSCLPFSFPFLFSSPTPFYIHLLTTPLRLELDFLLGNLRNCLSFTPLLLILSHSFSSRNCAIFYKGTFDLALTRTPLLFVSSILDSHLPLFSSHLLLLLSHWFLSLLNCSHNSVYCHTYGIYLKNNNLFNLNLLLFFALKTLSSMKHIWIFCSSCLCFVITHFLFCPLPPHQAVSSNPLRPCLTAWPMGYRNQCVIFTFLQHLTLWAMPFFVSTSFMAFIWHQPFLIFLLPGSHLLPVILLSLFDL